MYGLVTDGDDDLVKKEGATLYAWNFFGIKKDNNTVKDSASSRIC